MKRIWIVVFVLAACVPASPTFEISGVALAGPTCPVETDPPDPSCAPRPVVGAVIEAVDSTGSVRATAVTGESGDFMFPLPAGDYTIVPQPVEGLMGVASAVEITVGDSAIDLGILVYDTGIR